MADIFPSFVSALTEAQPQVQNDLPLYKECKWDFENNKPIFKNGQPVIITGHKAVLTWAHHALLTVRGRWEIHTPNYGSDIETLIGSAWSSELVTAEAMQYIKECLLESPYITSVFCSDISFSESTLTIKCKIETIYSESEENYELSL